jgi:hypothetical protein
MNEQENRPAYVRLTLFIGGTASSLGSAWIVAYGVIVATSNGGKGLTVHPFWIAPTYASVGALAIGIALVAFSELSRPRHRRATNESNLPRRKYSEVVWAPGASAQVSAGMLGQDPQHFRIVTPRRTPMPSVGTLSNSQQPPTAAPVSPSPLGTGLNLEAEFEKSDTMASQLADENKDFLLCLQRIADLVEKRWPAIEKTSSPEKQRSLASNYSTVLRPPALALDKHSREIASLSTRLNAGVNSVLTRLEADRNVAIKNWEMIEAISNLTAQIKKFRGTLLLDLREIAEAADYQGDETRILKAVMTTISAAAKRVIDAYQVFGDWESRVDRLAQK